MTVFPATAAEALYLADRSLGTVLFLALKMGRPTFLEGEAGVRPYGRASFAFFRNASTLALEDARYLAKVLRDCGADDAIAANR
jgi:hypothetical protein